MEVNGREYRVFQTVPTGWKIMQGATCHPHGYRWINNGKSIFDKSYERALLEVH